MSTPKKIDQTKPWYFVVGTLKFLVTIEDIRNWYGNPQFLIKPVSGTGKKWESASNLESVDHV